MAYACSTIFIASALTLALSAAAAAVERKSAVGAGTIQRPAAAGTAGKLGRAAGLTSVVGTRPTTVAPLNDEECEKLGGSVGDLSVCTKTGKSCQRADENGKVHTVCLDEIVKK